MGTLPLEHAADRPNARTAMGRLLELLPGIALLFAVGYLGKLIEQSIGRYGKAHHQALPNIEYVMWAILIGMFITNVFGLPRIFRAGVATYEFWLKAGIILLGARFIFGDMLRLGGVSLLLVFVELALALTFMTYLGRAFRLSPKLVTLLAVGSSVCGVSAIIATQGAIEAEEEDSSVAIAAILLLGALSLFVFPLGGPRPAHERPCLWPVDRPGRRQHGRGDGCGRAVLRRRGQVRGAGQDVPQRDDWLCGAGLRAVLVRSRAGCGHRQQGCVSLEEVSRSLCWASC